MFSLTRTTAKRAPQELIRSFSVAVSTEVQKPSPLPPTGKAGPSHGRSRIAKRAHELPPLSNTKVPVPDDHGLYAFFRKKTGNNDTGEAAYEVVETPDQGQLSTGKPFPTRHEKRVSDLRVRSSLGSGRASQQELQRFAYPVVCGAKGA